MTADIVNATQGQLAKDVQDIKLLLGYIFVCALLFLGFLLVRFIYYQFSSLFN